MGEQKGRGGRETETEREIVGQERGGRWESRRGGGVDREGKRDSGPTKWRDGED